MEPLKEYTNVTFDEIQIGATTELAVTLTQSQIDLAAMVSGDVDAFYLMQPGDADKRQEAKKTEAAGAEAIISIVLGTRLPGPGQRSFTGICVLPEISPWGIRLRRRSP